MLWIVCFATLLCTAMAAGNGTATPTPTRTQSASAAPTQTATTAHTATATAHATPSQTAAATQSHSIPASHTASSTATATKTPLASASPTPSATPQPTPSPSTAASATATNAPTQSATPTAATQSSTAAATKTDTSVATQSGTSSATVVPTDTTTVAATATGTGTLTQHATSTPVATMTKTTAATPSGTASGTQAPSPSVTPVKSSSATGSVTIPPSPTTTPQRTRSPSPSVTAAVTASASGVVTATETSTAAITASGVATVTVTKTLTASNTADAPQTASATATTVTASASVAPLETASATVTTATSTISEPLPVTASDTSSAMAKAEGNHTFPVVGQDGDTYFLLRTDLVPPLGAAAFPDGRPAFSCAAPPPLATTGRRSAVHVGSATNVTVDLTQAGPGEFFVCRKAAADTTAGYRGYAPEPWNVTVAPAVLSCPGSTVCQAVPATLSNLQTGAQDVRLVGLTDVGSEARLVHTHVNGQKLYSCTDLPPAGAQRHTAAVPYTGAALGFDVFNMTAGEYAVCVKPPAGLWSELPLTVAVSGAVDTMHSSLSCCAGPHLVGERVYCQVHARDAMDAPAGTADDACRFTVSMARDGGGAEVLRDAVAPPYFLETGVFEFYYVPERSGCRAAAGAAYGGSVLQNKVQMFTLGPREAVEAKFTAQCGVVTGAVRCNVTKRDEYSNPISTCNTMADGTVACG